MIDLLKRSWAVVNLDNIEHNIDMIKSVIPNSCMVLGVVKANAYGHGDVAVAKAMINRGVNWFGVSNINEAISLRNGGIHHPILIFGMTPSCLADKLCSYNITQAVYAKEQAIELQQYAQSYGVNVSCHIKLDTGMSRLGFPAAETETTCEDIIKIKHLSNLSVGGIFTHFCCADELCDSSVAYAENQFKLFSDVCNLLEEKGEGIKLRHCSSSGAFLNYPNTYMDMVRPGIVEYGIYPSTEINRKIGIKPAMELYTVIAMVKKVPSGTSVSYGRTFTSEKETLIATVPIGYADGFSRSLSNKGEMLVKGHRAKVVGRVCMDQLMLDVSDIPNVKAGDKVTIVGTDNGETITMEDLANACGTITYECMCAVSRRMPRVYIHNGQAESVLDYVLEK